MNTLTETPMKLAVRRRKHVSKLSFRTYPFGRSARYMAHLIKKEKERRIQEIINLIYQNYINQKETGDHHLLPTGVSPKSVPNRGIAVKEAEAGDERRFGAPRP